MVQDDHAWQVSSAGCQSACLFFQREDQGLRVAAQEIIKVSKPLTNELFCCSKTLLVEG